ncbi:MAG: amidohydrolase family protein [Thermodesulfobacteriota bacterium]
MIIFDSHFHIIDKKFPLIRLNNYIPDEFMVDEYLKKTQKMNIQGGAIVAGSFQGFEQDYLISALKLLGENFVGITQIPLGTSDEEILKLNNAGVRGVRFNIEAGGSEKLENLEKLALRIHDLCGWHVELHIKSSKITRVYDMLINLPSVSIDHLGYTKSGFDTLLKLVDKGIKVKASGFGRVDFDVKTALKEIVSVNTGALMFGTDLPSTRAKRPFEIRDIDIIKETFEENICTKIFYENAVNHYRLKEL